MEIDKSSTGDIKTADNIVIDEIKTGEITPTNSITYDTVRFLQPIEMIWSPKPDISTYELAQCIPFILRRNIMPFEVDLNQEFLRNFVIYDHNK